MFHGSNCNRKSQFSEILTEPLNPRALSQKLIHSFKIRWLDRWDFIFKEFILFSIAFIFYVPANPFNHFLFKIIQEIS